MVFPVVSCSWFCSRLVFVCQRFKITRCPSLGTAIVVDSQGNDNFVLPILTVGTVCRTTDRKVEKPTIVLVQDNSASVVSTKDSVYYKTKYLSDYKEFAGKLREKYEVDEYCFGESLSNDTVRFDEKMTNISFFFINFAA